MEVAERLGMQELSKPFVEPDGEAGRIHPFEFVIGILHRIKQLFSKLSLFFRISVLRKVHYSFLKYPHHKGGGFLIQ
jgi:hypothetical protein